MIKEAIHRSYGFDVPVLVRTLAELKQIQKINPFLENNDIDVDGLHVTFLSEIPEQTLIQSIAKFDYPPSQFVIIGKNVFIYCPQGYGKTKLNNEFFESKLKVSASTRNWRTVNTLVEIATNL